MLPAMPSSTLWAMLASGPSLRSGRAMARLPRSSPGVPQRLIALELDHALAAELTFRFRDRPRGADHRRRCVEDRSAGAGTSGRNCRCDRQPALLHHLGNPAEAFSPRSAGLVSRAVLMMQREVAERVAAAPGVRDYGLLSATAQMNAQVESLFTLPPSAFSPPPEVYSTVLRLHFAPRFAELGVDPSGFDAFLKQSFAQKRKTLQNNLRAAGYSAEELAAAWPTSMPRTSSGGSAGVGADGRAIPFAKHRDPPTQPSSRRHLSELSAATCSSIFCAFNRTL